MNDLKNTNYFSSNSERKKRKTVSERNLRSVILFTISVVYGLLIYFIIHIGDQGYRIFSLYVYGLLGGVGLLFLNKYYDKVDNSRQILTEVLEKSSEARAITDAKGRTIYTNERFLNFINQDDKPSFGSFTKLFSDPLEVREELEELKKHAAPAGSASKEFYAVRNGKDQWIEVTCQHIVGWEGYVHWRVDDITLRHEMALTIREEREKLSDFSNNSPVGFFSTDDNGIFIFANKMMAEILETTVEDLVGKAKLHDFIGSETEELRPYECFKSDGKQTSREIILKGKSGSKIKTSITQSISSANDTIIARSIVYDLTKEQTMRRALQMSQDRFQRLFEESPIGICILNQDKKITSTNHTLLDILSKDEEIDNSHLLEHIKEEHHAELIEWIDNLNHLEEEQYLELTLKNKAETNVQLYANKFKSDNSIVLHFIDLTERKSLEQQFAQSQKMQAVGQLAGGIAHDFNNLLTAMIGFADLLLLRHKPGDPSFSDINQIKQNANRASNMVRQLLAFSRQQTLKARVLDLSDVLSELSHLLRRLIGVNIELNISHNTNSAIVKADQGQIEQVLINLVVNARDAMEDGGSIDISTEEFSNETKLKLSGEDTLPKGDWIIISVKDAGTGIPEDVIGHIFEPFFSTKPVGAGTGLGLATVHGIIHQTGGRIAVDSEIGVGTTFKIYLPKHSKGSENVEEITEAEEPKITDLTGSSSILLVEDEDAVRIFSSRALSNKGYEVVDVASGDAALRVLEERDFKPDMLITDVMMPEMDGTTLAKIVAEKYPEIKIIFISGYAEDKFKEHVGGNAYFLPKPFTLKQLAERVKEVIDA